MGIAFGLALGGFGLFTAGGFGLRHGRQDGVSKNLTELCTSIKDSLDEEEKPSYII
ncbi:MAG: hypothetical protein H0U73_00390 [Tatlockia sp.]|nr:hypothetical protein [Tatlockia sp.]